MDVMPSPAIGTRCGLVAATDPDGKKLFVLGLATCRGEDIPPACAAGSHSERFRRTRTPVSFFELDADGALVWSTECTCLEESRYHMRLSTLDLLGYHLHQVNVAQLRSSLRSTDDDDDFPTKSGRMHARWTRPWPRVH